MHANIFEFLQKLRVLSYLILPYQQVYANANVSNFIGALSHVDEISNSNRRFRAISRYLNKTLRNILNQLFGIEHGQFLRVLQRRLFSFRRMKFLLNLTPIIQLPEEHHTDDEATHTEGLLDSVRARSFFQFEFQMFQLSSLRLQSASVDLSSNSMRFRVKIYRTVVVRNMKKFLVERVK